ncbi:MAG: glycerophosphodiester phosphodiesterase family protein [Acidobacteriota bacterium]|nr:glycerophosphodiester phosphodiesterase family protein [Acidobacteriota bacterium]MDH3523739.1 glycerophosphodiester phosphodiesterase family protein [Acidobacteriota bacterium]
MKHFSACPLVAALFLAAGLAPGVAHPDPADEHTRPFEIQGHRGAAGLAPENSIAAFAQAIALGTDTLEMDAQATSDRVLVVYHDQKIDGTKCRKIGGAPLRSRVLKDLSLAEVREIRCDAGAGVPTLEEVLRLAHAAPYAVRVNVEIKMQKASRGIPVGEFAALLVDVIDATGMRGRALVQSFDVEALLSMRRIAPDIPRAVIARDRETYLPLVEETTASALLPRRDGLRQEDVEALHARGVAVIPWVVDDPEEMRRLRSWGIDGIITNRPDLGIELRDGRPRRVAEAAATPPPPPTPWPPPAPAPTPAPTPRSESRPPAAAHAPPPAETPPRAYDLSEVRRVAVTYFTSGGNTDTFLTSLFLERFSGQSAHETIDPYQLSMQPKDGQAYHPAGMLDKLFAEAAEHSAQAIIVGVGKWYGPVGSKAGFRLEVRLIEIREGRVLWQATASSGFAISGPSAKREVVKKVLKTYPGTRRR